ncbi:MAG: dihydrofolate reductase [Verrucomicrobia bacterium]|jgi:dihydrofolate reductase|nr:dihydrofolate reductase [Verrucomicrobiota bacterium]
MPRPLQLIAACARNRVIGRAGRLPWSIPEDLAFFHHTTAGQTCVLGRVSYENWPRAHADGRRPIVVSRRADLPGGALVVPSLTAALARADHLPGEIFICGGQRIYAESLALAGQRDLRLYLTLIEAEIPGDTWFPEWQHLPWQEADRREGRDGNYRYTFLTLDLPASTPPA